MKPTRAEAIKQGLVKYHGKPCKKCGGTARYTLNSACVACQFSRVEKERQEIREARSA